jgi:aminopeptidase N
MGYKPGETHVFTQGEAIEARHWYPCYDSPNEKFTSEIIAHVPDEMVVLSNGKKISEEKDSGDLKAVRWSQEKPHANYLISLIAGNFKHLDDQYKNVPLAFYTPPSQFNEAENSFRDTKDIMGFFEKEIGVPFPWAKYFQVVVDDFVAGGMENTSITTLTDRTLFRDETENLHNSEGLCSHEMAHQWFGDLVTCKDWSQLWLYAGFATFYALLYDEHKNGRDSMLYAFYGSAKGLLKATNDVQPIVFRKYDKPMEQFNALVYQKGSWVLHMLRAQLGDELYRRCIKTYLERHQFGNVVTEDLRAVVEELSGRSYDQFFDQWLYHAHYPEIEAEYSWDQKSKFAKISIKQVQKISDDVLLFNFPLTVRFKGKFGKVEQTISVKEKEEDFYFALDSAPEIARLDPNFDLLARIKFKLPNAMLYAQLADKDDMVGRLVAIDQLAEKKDHETIKRLKRALDDDPFFGVRIEAAKALQAIHEDEALDALLATKQKDARVRNQVAASIGGFFNGNSFERAIANISKEKNPDIRAQWIRALGNFSKPESREVLIPLLQTDSYRNVLAGAAISAMRAQDDLVYIKPILKTLRERETNFTSRGFVAGLDALAYISRNEKKKDSTREFLIRHVNDRKQAIQAGAIAALGTLEDPEATAVLETFANTGKDTPERKAAEKSLSTIRSAGKPSDDLKKLREEILDLQKARRENKKQIEALNKKLESKTQKPTAKAIRSPRGQP